MSAVENLSIGGENVVPYPRAETYSILDTRSTMKNTKNADKTRTSRRPPKERTSAKRLEFRRISFPTRCPSTKQRHVATAPRRSKLLFPHFQVENSNMGKLSVDSGGRLGSRAGTRGGSRTLNTRGGVTSLTTSEEKTRKFSRQTPTVKTPQLPVGPESDSRQHLEVMRGLFKPYKVGASTT